MAVLRRIRGVLGSALLWATTWGFAGGLFYAVAGATWTIEAGHRVSLGAIAPYVFMGAIFLAIYGGLSGAVFSLILALIERGRTIEDLTIRRMAGVGALGAATVLLTNLLAMYFMEGGLPGDTILALLMMSLLGAGCAAVSLSLAREAPQKQSAGHLGQGSFEYEIPERSDARAVESDGGVRA
jgi:hypothetical protein